MNNDIIDYLINRLLAMAKETSEEMRKNPEDVFIQGKNLAYYEMLSALKDGIEMYNIPAEQYNLDVELEKFL